MKKLIIAIVILFSIPFISIPFISEARIIIPQPEYVTQKTIKEVCGLGKELLGCMVNRPARILIYWKVQANPLLTKKIYWHEVGHFLTGKWYREDYIYRLGYADINENDVITLSEKMANDYEDYKTIGIKDKKKIREFKRLERINNIK